MNDEETADGPTGEQQEEQLQFEEESSCEINPAVLEMQKRIEMLSSKMKDLQQRLFPPFFVGVQISYFFHRLCFRNGQGIE